MGPRTPPERQRRLERTVGAGHHVRRGRGGVDHALYGRPLRTPQWARSPAGWDTAALGAGPWPRRAASGLVYADDSATPVFSLAERVPGRAHVQQAPAPIRAHELCLVGGSPTAETMAQESYPKTERLCVCAHPRPARPAPRRRPLTSQSTIRGLPSPSRPTGDACPGCVKSSDLTVDLDITSTCARQPPPHVGQRTENLF